jgi:hypothetical protein
LAVETRTERASVSPLQPGMATSAVGSGTFAALRRYALFRRLWLASFGYSLSQWMQSIALGWLAFDLTDSERFVGLIAFAAGLPFIVVSIPSGALLDRFDRRRVLLISQAAAAAVAVVVATDVLSGNVEPWHLLVAGFVNGSLQAIIAPSQQAIVPRLVQPEGLQNALGLMSAGAKDARLWPGRRGRADRRIGHRVSISDPGDRGHRGVPDRIDVPLPQGSAIHEPTRTSRGARGGTNHSGTI